MLGELVADGVDVLEDDGVEARQMSREELVHGELNQGEITLVRVRIVFSLRALAQDEERDDVDGLVSLEPATERPHVVRRTSGEVQQSHTIAGDGERQEPRVVLRELVPLGGLDRHLDHARACPIERDGEFHPSYAIFYFRFSGREERRSDAASELRHRHRHHATREAPRAADLDGERKRLMGHRGARCANQAN